MFVEREAIVRALPLEIEVPGTVAFRPLTPRVLAEFSQALVFVSCHRFCLPCCGVACSAYLRPHDLEQNRCGRPRRAGSMMNTCGQSAQVGWSRRSQRLTPTIPACVSRWAMRNGTSSMVAPNTRRTYAP